MLRLGACLGVAVDIIEPCGFPFSEHALRRAGMDYLEHVKIGHHNSWKDFEAFRRDQGRRLILLTTKAEQSYLDLTYLKDDILLVGQESAGVPDEVHKAADERIVIPMQPGLRSLNVAMSAAMVLGEALRQTREAK